MTPGGTQKQAIDIPNSSAVMLVGIEDHEEHEFSIGDTVHNHRLFDVYVIPDDHSQCIVEVPCSHCCRMNYVTVTTKRGLPAGPGGKIQCEYCKLRAELFTIEPNRGRIQLYSRRKGCMVSVTMADAAKVFRQHRYPKVDLTAEVVRQAAAFNMPVVQAISAPIPLRERTAS